MGNVQGQSMEKKPKRLMQVINFVAANYILTQSFTDLVALTDKAYCDKLIIITSGVFDKYFTKTDVNFLAQKMKQGVAINEMNHDELMYLRRDDIEDLGIKNPTSKKRKCIGIAKYYIKIAHIFGAILMTINPTYIYKESDGTSRTVEFSKKNTIPQGADIKLNKLNLCSERVNALINGHSFSTNDTGQPIKIKPQFCQMNINKDKTRETGVKVVKTLGDEPGIDQLDKLYNDIYNSDNGEFTGMSENMRETYNKDLHTMYTAFTGNKEMPLDIKSFSQIPLRDFTSLSGCKGKPNNQYMQEYEGTTKDKLFVDYANHMREMMESSEKGKNALVGIFDQLFVFDVNPMTKKAEITINPKLSDDMLNKIVKETQLSIINLYTTCEENFIKGLQIFEQIIDEQLKLREGKDYLPANIV